MKLFFLFDCCSSSCINLLCSSCCFDLLLRLLSQPVVSTCCVNLLFQLLCQPVVSTCCITLLYQSVDSTCWVDLQCQLAVSTCLVVLSIQLVVLTCCSTLLFQPVVLTCSFNNFFLSRVVVRIVTHQYKRPRHVDCRCKGGGPLRPLHLSVLRLTDMKLKPTSRVSSGCSLLTFMGSLRRGF